MTLVRAAATSRPPEVGATALLQHSQGEAEQRGVVAAEDSCSIGNVFHAPLVEEGDRAWIVRVAGPSLYAGGMVANPLAHGVWTAERGGEVEGGHVEALLEQRHSGGMRSAEGVDGLQAVADANDPALGCLGDHDVVKLGPVLHLVPEDVVEDGEAAAHDGGQQQLIGVVDATGEGVVEGPRKYAKHHVDLEAGGFLDEKLEELLVGKQGGDFAGEGGGNAIWDMTAVLGHLQGFANVGEIVVEEGALLGQALFDFLEKEVVQLALRKHKFLADVLGPDTVAETVEGFADDGLRHPLGHLIRYLSVEGEAEDGALEVPGKLDESGGLGGACEGLDEEVVLGVAGSGEDGGLFGGPLVGHLRASFSTASMRSPRAIS